MESSDRSKTKQQELHQTHKCSRVGLKYQCSQGLNVLFTDALLFVHLYVQVMLKCLRQRLCGSSTRRQTGESLQGCKLNPLCCSSAHHDTESRGRNKRGQTKTSGRKRRAVRTKSLNLWAEKGQRELSVCPSLARCKSQSPPITPVSITPGCFFKALLFIHQSVWTLHSFLSLRNLNRICWPTSRKQRRQQPQD